MDIFRANSDVTLIIPLADAEGNAYNVSAISYRVVNQDEVEVLALTPLTSFSAGSSEATITVLAVKNVLATGSIRELRNIELYLTEDENQITIRYPYVIEASQVLVVGENSFQTYAQALLTGMEISDIPAWNAASEQDRLTALMDARHHIVQLHFTLLTGYFDQSNIAYFGDMQFETPYISKNNVAFLGGNLDLLKPAQYAALPEKMRQKLRLAQVAEADAILGSDPIKDQRESGLISSTIGEVSQRYREGKPMQLPVCSKALSYLSYYISFTRRVGRG
jgi:hypothetical protein